MSPVRQIKRRLIDFVPLWRTRTSSRRLLPDFIIIGGQRCGSTSLYSYISGHPRVEPSLKKEVHFFDLDFDLGERWYRSHFPLRPKATIQRELLGRRFISGEATPYYMFHPAVPSRIARVVPDARLIAVLRNPVDRAISHYHHEVRKRREFLPIEAALAAEEGRLAGAKERLLAGGNDTYSFNHHRYSYKARGRYAEQLQRWLKHFPAEQLLVLRSEDLYEDPAQTLGDVFDFLQLPGWMPDRFKAHGSRSYPAALADVRRQLWDYFEPHNEALEALLGRTMWERPASGV